MERARDSHQQPQDPPASKAAEGFNYAEEHAGEYFGKRRMHEAALTELAEKGQYCLRPAIEGIYWKSPVEVLGEDIEALKRKIASNQDLLSQAQADVESARGKEEHETIYIRAKLEVVEERAERFSADLEHAQQLYDSMSKHPHFSELQKMRQLEERLEVIFSAKGLYGAKGEDTTKLLAEYERIKEERAAITERTSIQGIATLESN